MTNEEIEAKFEELKSRMDRNFAIIIGLITGDFILLFIGLALLK